MEHSRVGICVIGHNEGGRLRGALEAVRKEGVIRVFVDGASTDNSLLEAGRFSDDIDVVALQADERCTAALGRNRGFEYLLGRVPELAYVQFVDGDCTLTAGWLDAGVAYLEKNPDVAIVAGRLRELDRERNYFHRIADMEWNTHEGDVHATGGICLVRADVYSRLGGMDGAITRGEEAELAKRVRAQGFRIVRLAGEMAHHDIDMDRVSQWWRRSMRYGGGTADELQRSSSASRGAYNRVFFILAWGLVLPGTALGFAFASHGWSLALLGLYTVLWVRVRASCLRRGNSVGDASLYATSVLLGKAANACGILQSYGIWLQHSFRATPPLPMGAPCDGVIPLEPAQEGGPECSPRTKAPGFNGKRVQISFRSNMKARVRSALIHGARVLGALDRFESRMNRGLTALMYHRVLPDELCADYPLGSLVIPVSAFTRQMQYIADHYDAGTISEGLLGLARGRFTRPSVAITFDDGYRDNFEIVAPILEDCGLHATFFVTTDFVSTGSPMWFDEACLMLRVLGPKLSRSLILRRAPANGADLMAWMNRLKAMAPDERKEALSVWRSALDGMPDERRIDASGFGAMKPADLRELHARGHEIGSHSCSHPLLTQMAPEAMGRELVKSKAQLEQWIGVPVEGFCYPNGDHNSPVRHAVREAGYSWAVTASSGLCTDLNTEFVLPRVGITSQHVLDSHGNHDDDLFRAEVCRFRGTIQHPWS